MSDFDNTNRAVLFSNDRKTKDSQPSHTGSANVDGVEYFLDAWVKEKNGKKFFSMSLKRKDKQPGQTRPATTASYAPAPAPKPSSGFDDMDSDIPFLFNMNTISDTLGTSKALLRIKHGKGLHLLQVNQVEC